MKTTRLVSKQSTAKVNASYSYYMLSSLITLAILLFIHSIDALRVY